MENIYENRDKFFSDLLLLIDNSLEGKFWVFLNNKEPIAESWILGVLKAVRISCNFSTEQANKFVFEKLIETEVIPSYVSFSEFLKLVSNKILKSIFSKKIKSHNDNFEKLLFNFQEEFFNNLDKNKDKKTQDIEEDTIRDKIKKSVEFKGLCKKILSLQLEAIKTIKNKKNLSLDCNYSIGYINSFVLNYGRNSEWQFSTSDAADDSLIVIIYLLYDDEDHSDKFTELQNRVNYLLDINDSEFFKGYNDGIKLSEQIIENPESLKRASVTVFSDWYNYFSN